MDVGELVWITCLFAYWHIYVLGLASDLQNHHTTIPLPKQDQVKSMEEGRPHSLVVSPTVMYKAFRLFLCYCERACLQGCLFSVCMYLH